MRSQIINAAIIASFALGACASPHLFERRDTCAHDTCYRSVFGTNAPAPGTAKASADCSSLFVTTVVPCPITSTVTSTATQTSATTTVTITTYSSTKIVTATSSPAKNKREEEKRAATTCSASTTSATSIPSYASSACSGYARYSSVCACQGGISRSTSTASAPTSYTTVTLTNTIKFTSTSTVRKGVTTTTTTIGSSCTSFYLQASATTAANGYYFANGPGHFGSSFLAPGKVNATVFTSNSNGNLVQGTNAIYNQNDEGNLEFEGITTGNQLNILACMFAATNPYTGMVYCSNNGNLKPFVTITSDNSLFFVGPDQVSDYNGGTVDFTAVPAC